MLVLASILFTVGTAATVPNAPPGVPRIVSEHRIPLDSASDVRWAGADHVLVTDVTRGIAQVTVPGGDVSWLPEWAPPHAPGTLYAHLATSGAATLVSDVVFEFEWRERDNPKLHEEVFYYIEDVDLDGDRLLVLGYHNNPLDKTSSSQGFAWLGSLKAGDVSFRPILPYRNMDAISGCLFAGLGVVRFLSNGSFIVVPGAEPGIYLFGKDGKLRRLWQTDALGLDMNCSLPEQHALSLRTDSIARQERLNKYKMVDEVVETPSGPALITRKFTDGAAHWNAVVLNTDGSTSERPLPFTSPSPYAHVAAASRGDRIAFVIGNRGLPKNPASFSRLIILEWPKQ